MARTEVRSEQIKDDNVKRDDLNTTQSGQAVTRKIIAGDTISIGSTGVDAGTGDVTINLAHPVPLDRGGTNGSTRQAGLNNLTAVGSANTGDVLTKNGSGNAVFLPGAGAVQTSFTPVFTVFGGSISSVSIIRAIWWEIGNIVEFSIEFTCNLSSTPDYIQFTTPGAPSVKSGNIYVGNGVLEDDGVATNGYDLRVRIDSSSKYFAESDRTSMPNGTGSRIIIRGHWEKA